MKLSARICAVLLAFICIAAPILPALQIPTKSAEQTESYTEKVVSVLYDNSGSMNNDSDNRRYYALYALQMLVSLLNPQDTLVVTPMNKNGVKVTDTSAGVEVDLSLSDRNAQIEKLLAQEAFADVPSGGTPKSSVDVATKQLTDRGMTTGMTDDENKEYWLVILSDGAFDGTGDKKKNTAETLAKQIEQQYSGFHMIYLSICDPTTNLSGVTGYQSLDNASNFTAYFSDTPNGIISAMQGIANQMSGRYTLENDAPGYTVSGNTVTVDLGVCDFALRNISILLQNCDATLQSATYNGTAMSISQACVIDADNNKLGMKDGYSAVLSTGDLLSGGTLTMKFSAPVSKDVLSVMFEPALYLLPVLEWKKDGVWAKCTTQEINSNLTPGSLIRVGYDIYAEGSNQKVTLTPDANGEKITYAGQTYLPGQEITLLKGINEIAISVSLWGGTYVLFGSATCVVEENPTFYRVESSVQKNGNNADFTFTVYANNTAIASSADLLAGYTYTATKTDANGNEAPITLQAQANGTLTYSIPLSDYGVYAIDMKITTQKSNISRTASAAFPHFPNTIALSAGTPEMSKTLYGLTQNTDPFTFALKEGENPLNFDGRVMEWTVKVGNVDVTAYCTAEGNILSFVPTAEALGDAQAVGEHTVTATIKIPLATNVAPATANSKLTLTQTVFEIKPFEPTGTVNRFNLKNNTSTVSFAVMRDGVPLPVEELQAALDNGTFSLSDDCFVLSPVRNETVVETLQDGTPVITVRPKEGHFGILRGLVTSMLTFGSDIDFNATYEGADATGTIGMQKASIIAYIWRVLLILYIIQLVIMTIHYFVTKNAVKRVPKGVLVRIPLEKGEAMDRKLLPAGRGNRMRLTTVKCIKVVREMDRLLLKRFVPFIGLAFRERTVSAGSMMLTPNDQGGVSVNGNKKSMKGTISNADRITGAVRSRQSTLGSGSKFDIENHNITVHFEQMTTEQKGLQPLTATTGLIYNNCLYLYVKFGY